MNLIEIAGFLGADAEERTTSGGKRVISLRLAARSRQGKEDVTIWWRVNLWGDRFDKMLPYFKKGTALIVVGEMSKPETYVDKAGQTQISLTVNGEIVKFSPFGGKKEGGQEGRSSFGAPSFDASHDEMAFAGAAAGEKEHQFANDDLPF